LADGGNATDIQRCNSGGSDAVWPRAGIANFVLKALVFSVDMPVVVPWLHIDGTTKAYWYGGDENDSRMNGAAVFSRLDVKPKSAAANATEQSLIYAWNQVYLIMHQIVNTSSWSISPRVLDRGLAHPLSVALGTHSDAFDNSNTLTIAQTPSRYVHFQKGPFTYKGKSYDGIVWSVQIVNAAGKARSYLTAIGAWPILIGPNNVPGAVCQRDLTPSQCATAINQGERNGIYTDPLLMMGSLPAGPRLDDSGNVIGQRETLVVAFTSPLYTGSLSWTNPNYNFSEWFRDAGADNVYGNADDVQLLSSFFFHAKFGGPNFQHQLGLDGAWVYIDYIANGEMLDMDMAIPASGTMLAEDRHMMSYTAAPVLNGDDDDIFGGSQYSFGSGGGSGSGS
jgi:hypothetical protein